MENEVTTYTLESDILCKYVYHIGVTKVRKYEQITRIHSKGDKVHKFKLFGKPFSYRICEDDEYFVSRYGIHGTLYDIIFYLDKLFPDVFYEDGWLYHYGIVDIYYLGNEKPEKFVNELKEKCKDQGNVLK